MSQTPTTTPEVLGRDAFLNEFSGRRYATVQLPNGKAVRIQSMTDFEHGEYQVAMLSKIGDFDPDKGKKSARLLMAYCCVDEAGNRLFVSENDIQNIDTGVTLLLRKKIREHCGLNVEDPDVEDAQKK